MKKTVFIGIISLLFGLFLGSFITYQVMNEKETEKDAKDKLTFQEILAKETKKLLLRNDMYNYVESIEKRVKLQIEENKKLVLTYSSYLFLENSFTQIDEKGKIVKDGLIIDNIVFRSDTPKEGSTVTINEKGNVVEATIYVEGFELQYDFIGVKVKEK